MDAKIKRKWVKALRSGEYDQGKNQLCSDDGTEFCCLGVLADIQGAYWREVDDILYPILPSGIRQRSFTELSRPYMAGLTSDQQDTLMGMNDMGAPFSKIADYIDRNL